MTDGDKYRVRCLRGNVIADLNSIKEYLRSCNKNDVKAAVRYILEDVELYTKELLASLQ